MNSQRIGNGRDPGVIFESVAMPGAAVVCRVAAHDGASVQSAGKTSLIVQTEAASVVRIAFYAAPVLANRWEPFDQPIPAAYMPLPFSAFERFPVDGTGGEVLIQVRPRQERLRAVLVNDGQRRICEFLPVTSAAELFRRLLDRMRPYGLSEDVERQCADRLRSCCADLLAFSTC